MVTFLLNKLNTDINNIDGTYGGIFPYKDNGYGSFMSYINIPAILETDLVTISNLKINGSNITEISEASVKNRYISVRVDNADVAGKSFTVSVTMK